MSKLLAVALIFAGLIACATQIFREDPSPAIFLCGFLLAFLGAIRYSDEVEREH